MSATYFEVAECPLSYECNEDNFKKWKPRGRSEEEARSQVLLHLKRSGCHKAHCGETGSRDE